MSLPLQDILLSGNSDWPGAELSEHAGMPAQGTEKCRFSLVWEAKLFGSRFDYLRDLPVMNVTNTGEQVMLNLANFQRGAFRGDDLEVAEAEAGSVGEVASKFDLTLYVRERDGGINVHLVYAADLFDAPRMRGLLAQLEGVLRQAAAAPETRIGALSLATEAARGVLPDPARPIREPEQVVAEDGTEHEVDTIVFACEAGMGSSVMGVNALKKKLKQANLSVNVMHKPVRSVPKTSATQ